MRQLFLSLFLLCVCSVNAQPFIDLIALRYTKSPDAGILRRNKQDNHFSYFQITANLPFVFKKDSSVLVLSPFTEQWYLRLKNASYLPDHLQSIAFPVAYIKPLSSKWTMTVSLFPRWNGNSYKWVDNNFQLGGALLAGYKKNQLLKFKFGVYYNSEFSGSFFMPLLGLDWKVDPKNNIFGVLPGNMVWEHKAGRNFYYGVVFRAITNTFWAGQLYGDDYFVRIDENQLSLYSDIYLAKRIVFNLEAGHSVLRQLRMGFKNGPDKYFFHDKTNDDFIFKAALAYRLRL